MARTAADTESTAAAPETAPVLGLRQNLAQFSLLVLVNAFVSGVVVASRMSETLARRNAQGGDG